MEKNKKGFIKNKKGFLGTIILIIILVIVGFFWFVKNYDSNNNEIKECEIDTDCIPDACCHATSCTAINNAPQCEGTFCSADCQPGTMDCGQGSCSCVEGKCETIINEEGTK